MECVDEVDALIVAAAAVERLFEFVGAIEDDIAGSGLRPSALQELARAGRPVHLPMALQPSTQSCRVICVRDGSFFRSASDKASGRSDQAVDLQSPVDKSVFRAAAHSLRCPGCGAVGAEDRRQVRFGELTRQRLSRKRSSLRAHGQAFGGMQDLLHVSRSGRRRRSRPGRRRRRPLPEPIRKRRRVRKTVIARVPLGLGSRSGR